MHSLFINHTTCVPFLYLYEVAKSACHPQIHVPRAKKTPRPAVSGGAGSASFNISKSSSHEQFSPLSEINPSVSLYAVRAYFDLETVVG